MNIVFIVETYHPFIGGVSILTRNLSRELKKNGHQVYIITPQYDGLPEFELIDSLDVFRIPVCSAQAFFLRKAWYTFRGALRMRALCRDKKIDIVNLHYVGFLAASTWVMSLLYTCKLIVMVSGSDVIAQKELFGNRRSGFILKRIARKADHVVACAKDLLEDVILRVPSIEKKSSVIHNGVDKHEFQAAVIFKHPRPYVFCAGSLSHYKGHDLLFMAFRAVADIYPGIDLIIAGAGPLSQYYHDLVGALGLGDRVVFLGLVNDRVRMVELFQGAMFFVLPSRYDSFSIAALEAMAAGKAVVVTDAGGMPEMVTNGTHGIVVKAKDIESLATAMSTLIADPGLRRALAHNGKEYVKNFYWEALVRQYIGLYQKVLAHSNG